MWQYSGTGPSIIFTLGPTHPSRDRSNAPGPGPGEYCTFENYNLEFVIPYALLPYLIYHYHDGYLWHLLVFPSSCITLLPGAQSIQPSTV